jgi:hypothetical protein
MIGLAQQWNSPEIPAEIFDKFNEAIQFQLRVPLISGGRSQNRRETR